LFEGSIAARQQLQNEILFRLGAFSDLHARKADVVFLDLPAVDRSTPRMIDWTIDD
jgi:hypothetical protein